MSDPTNIGSAASGLTTGQLTVLVSELEKRMVALVDGERMRNDQRFDLNDKALTAALTAAEKAVDAALTAAKAAVDKAEMAASKRFDSTNEFRAQLSDQAATFLPREVADAAFTDLRKQITSNTDRLNQMSGAHTGSAAVVAYVIAAAGIAIGVAGVAISVLH